MIVVQLLRVVSWIWFLQPLGMRRTWGNSLGWMLRMLSLRAKVIQENLLIAYPGNTPEAKTQRNQTFIAAYRHLGNLVFEILMLFGPMKNYCLKYGEYTGLEHWRAAKAKGQGVIVLSSHVGNWEIMGATGGLKYGVDIMLVTKHLKPEWLHQAIEKGRTACHVRATYEPRTLRDVLTHLKNNGTVGFVLDQFAGPPVGVRVPVFGVPVGTQTAVATLAKRTGAIVLPTVNYRTSDGRVVIEIQSPLQWIEHEDPSYEIAVNTAHYAAILEGHILKYPEQWLWTHRRFKGDLTPLRENEWYEGRVRR